MGLEPMCFIQRQMSMIASTTSSTGYVIYNIFISDPFCGRCRYIYLILFKVLRNPEPDCWQPCLREGEWTVYSSVSVSGILQKQQH